jgi:hypothetical protein
MAAGVAAGDIPFAPVDRTPSISPSAKLMWGTKAEWRRLIVSPIGF